MVSSNYSNVPTPVPFPQPDDIDNEDASTPATRKRSSTSASAMSNRLRTATGRLMEASPPPGMWAATGHAVAKAPSLKDIRTGSFGSDGWNEHAQRSRAGSRASRSTAATTTASSEQTDRPRGAARKTSSINILASETFPAVAEEDAHHEAQHDGQHDSTAAGMQPKQSGEKAAEPIHHDRPHTPKRTSSGHVRQPCESLS